MTRTEAMAIINRTLDAADDATLAEAAARLAQIVEPAGVTASDIAGALTSDSALPRELTERELTLIEQSKEDFRVGRTYTMAESRAYIDAELERRRQQRSNG
jgi:hypothetical protein